MNVHTLYTSEHKNVFWRQTVKNSNQQRTPRQSSLCLSITLLHLLFLFLLKQVLFISLSEDESVFSLKLYSFTSKLSNYCQQKPTITPKNQTLSLRTYLKLIEEFSSKVASFASDSLKLDLISFASLMTSQKLMSFLLPG